MPSKKHQPEEVIGKPREAEIVLAQGAPAAEACRRGRCSVTGGRPTDARLPCSRRRLGSQFDITAFHDLVLLSGSMPLEVLSSLANDWDGDRLS